MPGNQKVPQIFWMQYFIENDFSSCQFLDKELLTKYQFLISNIKVQYCDNLFSWVWIVFFSNSKQEDREKNQYFAINRREHFSFTIGIIEFM